MKVKELIPFLETQNPEAVVLLSSDEEGNTIEPLDINACGVAIGNFDKEKGNPYSITDSIYTMEEYEQKGPYIVLYPR